MHESTVHLLFMYFTTAWLRQISRLGTYPSSIYSWSIGHILEHEFFCLGRLGSQGSKEKKWIWGILSNFWGWCFQLFVCKKNIIFQRYFSIRIEKLHEMAFIIFFLKFEKIEKIDYHSNFNFECNTERGFKESLSIALGKLRKCTNVVYNLRKTPSIDTWWGISVDLLQGCGFRCEPRFREVLIKTKILIQPFELTLSWRDSAQF